MRNFRQMIDYIGQIPELPPYLIETIHSLLTNNQPTVAMIKNIFKSLKLQKYYEYIPFIYNHLAGIKQVTIPDEIKQEIMQRFSSIHEAHRLAFNGKRSFFNYNFVLTKILQEMRPFQDDVQIIAFVDMNQIKSIEKLKCIEADWSHIVDIMRHLQKYNRYVY